MDHWKRRWLSLLLTLAMVLGMFPSTVFAVENDEIPPAESAKVYLSVNNRGGDRQRQR
jgi:hypothetical protein